jgi:hypothetical protein
MNTIGNFPKCVISVAKPKNINFALTYVWEIFALFSDVFFMDLCSVDSDEAINASSLQFLSIAKRFIASSLQFFSQR